MYGILLSALNTVLGFVLKSVIIKFGVFFALYFVVTGFVGVLQSSGLLPSSSAVSGALGGIPSGVWYFLDLFAVSQGIPLILAAMLARFIIRRIPFIG
jgi:hypothetical protein